MPFQFRPCTRPQIIGWSIRGRKRPTRSTVYLLSRPKTQAMSRGAGRSAGNRRTADSFGPRSAVIARHPTLLVLLVVYVIGAGIALWLAPLLGAILLFALAV